MLNHSELPFLQGWLWKFPLENQCFIAGKSSNCPAMPRYEGRVGNGEDHNGSNRSKLRWQGMGRNLALKIGS